MALVIPDLAGPRTLERFCIATRSECLVLATGWDSAAARMAMELNALPIDHARFGRTPGTVVARHLRYMAKLARQTSVAAGLMWVDHEQHISIPLRASSASKWDMNK